MDQILEQKIEEWLANCQKMINEHYDKCFKNLTPSILKLDGGKKFLRVVTENIGTMGKSAFAFIAVEDGNTKTLGAYKKGDILKPATYKAPAKHARGNLFDNSNGMSMMSPYGPVYLK